MTYLAPPRRLDPSEAEDQLFRLQDDLYRSHAALKKTQADLNQAIRIHTKLRRVDPGAKLLFESANRAMNEAAERYRRAVHAYDSQYGNSGSPVSTE
jgi:multidrug resistance efflux pump